MWVPLKWLSAPLDLPFVSAHLTVQQWHKQFKPSETNVKTSIKKPLGGHSSQWLKEIRKKKILASKFPFHADINLLTFLQKHKINLKTVIIVSHEIKHLELFFFFLMQKFMEFIPFFSNLSFSQKPTLFNAKETNYAKN